MANLHIDRLVIKLTGPAPASAERLARRVAEGLGAARLAEAGASKVETMRLDVQASAASDADQLAARIVAELLKRLGGVALKGAR